MYQIVMLPFFIHDLPWELLSPIHTHDNCTLLFSTTCFVCAPIQRLSRTVLEKTAERHIILCWWWRYSVSDVSPHAHSAYTIALRCVTGVTPRRGRWQFGRCDGLYSMLGSCVIALLSTLYNLWYWFFNCNYRGFGEVTRTEGELAVVEPD